MYLCFVGLVSTFLLNGKTSNWRAQILDKRRLRGPLLSSSRIGDSILCSTAGSASQTSSQDTSNGAALHTTHDISQPVVHGDASLWSPPVIFVNSLYIIFFSVYVLFGFTLRWSFAHTGLEKGHLKRRFAQLLGGSAVVAYGAPKTCQAKRQWAGRWLRAAASRLVCWCFQQSTGRRRLWALLPQPSCVLLLTANMSMCIGDWSWWCAACFHQ